VLDLDGDGCSGRLGKLLTSGSVVLKPWAAGYPFFYNALTPWVHYVPVAPNLSDLLERVEWLQSHDEQAEAIGRQAARWARTALTAASIDDYTGALLRAVAQRQPQARAQARAQPQPRHAVATSDGDELIYRAGDGRGYVLLNGTDHKRRPLSVHCPARGASVALLEVSSAETLAKQYFESAEAALEVRRRGGNLRRYKRPN
jgi:hypothetical protein